VRNRGSTHHPRILGAVVMKNNKYSVKICIAHDRNNEAELVWVKREKTDEKGALTLGI